MLSNLCSFFCYNDQETTTLTEDILISDQTSEQNSKILMML
jgi:hypothetical protein